MVAVCALSLASALSSEEAAGTPARGTGAAPESWIAFARFTRVGKPQLFAVSADGRQTIRLLRHDGEDGEPAWSPDARWLAFSSVTSGNFQGILVARRDGRVIRRLTGHVYDPSNPVIDAHPRWSPDGKRIVFHRFRIAGSDLYVVNANGGRLRRLGPGFEPAWSPDGKWIAFAYQPQQPGNYDLYIMRADGSGRRQLVANPANDRHPDWSPDGRSVVFESDRGGNLDVYVVRIRGGEQRRLTFNEAQDTSPAWSPDGRRIVFARRVLGQFDLFVVNADGSGERRLTDTATVDEAQPAWEPLPQTAATRRQAR